MKVLADEQLQQAYRYAMSLANNHDTAKDIVHSAYINLLERNTSAVNNPQQYFLRSIRNLFIDQKRTENRRVMVPEQPDDNTVDMTTDTLEKMTIDQNLLATLWVDFSSLERELLYLWAIEEYTMEEISQLTDTPRGTLLSRIHRIRKKVASQSLTGGSDYEAAH